MCQHEFLVLSNLEVFEILNLEQDVLRMKLSCVSSTTMITDCVMAVLKLGIDGVSKLSLPCIVKYQVSFHSSLTSAVILSI
jgi:hypothetical protein